MARRSLARRAAGAALALCVAVVARPAAAQHEHHDVYPRVRAVIQAYYPSPANPSVLDWAEYIAAWNSLQILALQGILDIAALIGTCRSGDDPSCGEDRARYAVRSQVMGLEQACPVRLPAGERAACLFAVYQELGTLEQALHPWGQRFLMGLSDVWRIYAQHGRPDVARFRAIPELRRLAEMDTVMRFVLHLRATALAEKILLLEQIERELAGQEWAREVPRGGLFVTSARMQLAHAELEQEQIWTYRSYSLASAGWEGPFREWLELIRDGTISTGGLGLPPVRQQAVFPSPPAMPVTGLPAGALQPPPAPPRAVPDRVHRGLYLVLARDSVVTRERRSAIWVRGGRPIVLPGPGQPPARAEEPTPEPPEPTSGPSQGPEPPPPPPPPPPEPLPDDPYRRTIDFMDEDYWLDRMADVLERADGSEKARAGAIRLRALGGLFGAFELIGEIGDGDLAGSYTAAITLVGGPIGAFVLEITGFEDKLRKMEKAGRSLPKFMNHALAEGVASLIPFRRPVFYSEMPDYSGYLPEPLLQAEVRRHEQHVQEALEDRRRQKGRFSLFR